MLNKYPEICLRESVKLVDLQTSSIFCLFLPPMLFFSRPTVTRLQKAHDTKEGRRSETLKPITIDQSALRREQTAYLHTHANLSGYRKASQLILNRESMQNFSISHKKLKSPLMLITLNIINGTRNQTLLPLPTTFSFYFLKNLTI